MNIFQKIAAFLIRLLGFLSALTGILGFIYYALLYYGIGTIETESSAKTDLFSCIFYTVLGMILYIISKPLGKFLGAGFED